MYEAANTVTQYWDMCFKKKKGLKDKNNKYVFILIFYGNVKKNDLCFEMKHAFIVKLIMLF